MTTPDLPVELWLEILSYLPRSALRKTMGVNRMLFEMAFNDIYEEVRLIAADKEMVKTLKQLSHQNISQRVKFLLIRPAFLPGIDEVPTEGSTSSSKVYSWHYFKNRFHKPEGATLPNEHLHDPAYLVLEAASKGINNCMNLREVSIVIYDHSLTPAFRDFYQSLWLSNSLGPRLQKLSIETTQTKLPALLGPITANTHVLNNLYELGFMFGPTRFTPSPAEVHASRKALEKLLQKLKSQLTSLTFSSSAYIDFDQMLQLVPQLPLLRRISLSVSFNSRNFPSFFGPLFDFIQNSPALQKLEIRSSPRNIAVLFGPDIQYGLWLLGLGANCFQTLRLPLLETLHLEIPASPFLSTNVLFDAGKASFLSSISKVASNLKSLVFEGKDHSPADIKSMIDGLVMKDATPTLTNLEFPCENLTAEVFDLLASKLPTLRSLTIHPTTIGAAQETYRETNAFYDTMESRRYNSWALEKIRITSISYSCEMKLGHPDQVTMRKVVGCFPKRVIVDNEYLCDCLAIY
ncbi:hypothetical protein BJ165DRAFT_1497360 [Panaeolus papilionaceus]|nr:hypothetical protein BJ165DRAFT_1497360 [Panaeolus papilionaceus]